ncbi:hemolysin family protein [Hydrotalea sandarakina]|jgi:CBS domain containing-hemolysin-like protein|uniref:CBS domain containing-hemolysin-like protein n=1 Tax=Hydrotalea sandarakina TaxID=1004304 RepID=A0A2W7RNF6_9BACT|nr:hemolysin family protein [Hydrotalea sandarakina]PZX60506.1 CBS domain containing-hemolysin-like protein [Hydrotalea sandarakina]
MNELYTFIWLIVTLLFIGYFAGYEIAFLSANRLSIELKKKQGRNGGIIVSKFLEKPTQFIGTCLIGTNLFLVAYGLLFDELLNSSIWNFFKRFFDIENSYLKLVFNTFLSTLIVLIFGEFIPKAIFRARNDSLLIVFAPLAKFFHNIFQPLALFFVGISQWILKYIFNVPIKDKSEVFSKVDLEHLYQQNKDNDEENAEVNNELFENALSLPMVKIRQCLVPRTEIEAVEINTPLEEVREKYIQTKLSKLIVYEDTIDNILGYIHQLDLFKKPASIKDILLPIPTVPETMSATDLISKFSKERKTIAWVVDEFGGTAGIVTLEDVLEEIFGEIKDEYDTEELVEKQIAEKEYLLSGRLELDYLNEKYHLEFNDEESETLSGFIINKHSTIPKPKERIIIGPYQFDVLNVSETRIDMVKLKILE